MEELLMIIDVYLVNVRLIDKLMVMHPDIAFVFAAVCLQPGLIGQMADHPAGVHQETGSHCLRMKFSARDRRKTAVHALVDIVTDKAGAKAFRPVKEEIIAFRLRMGVREIAGPVAAVFITSPSTMLDQGSCS